MIKKGLNSISADSYFITLTNFENYFIHFEGDNPDNPEEEHYVVKQGLIGACIWTKQHAEDFIKRTGNDNLKPVKVTTILGNDGTLN